MRDVDMESWEISRRFVRELLILRRLRAVDGVVSLYGCSTPKPSSSRHRRDLYLWFEACLTDFRQLTKMDVFLTLADARRLLRELLLGLAHMHANDIIHRDIKPANLLLHADGTLKVCDFGLARVVPPAPKQQQQLQQPRSDDDLPETKRKPAARAEPLLPDKLPDKSPAARGMLEPELYEEAPKDDPLELLRRGALDDDDPEEQEAAPAPETLRDDDDDDASRTRGDKQPPPAAEAKQPKKEDSSSTGSLWSFPSFSFENNPPRPPATPVEAADDPKAAAPGRHRPSERREPQQQQQQQHKGGEAKAGAGKVAPQVAGSSKKVAFNLDGDGVDDGSTAEEASASASAGTQQLPARSELRRMYTEHVVTRWYRAPELVLLQPYNGAVDVWAAACVFAECFLGTCAEICGDRRDRRPLFPGRSCYPLSPMGTSRDGWHQKNDQLQAIFNVRGTPTPLEIDSLENDYRGMKAYLRRLAKVDKVPLERVFPAADPRALDLLEHMLAFSPEKRIAVLDALHHDYLAPSSTSSSKSRSVAYPDSDAGYDWSPCARPHKPQHEHRPSSAALGPAMSQLEDDEAWERVAQHEADADMSRVLWKLVDCFPSELAPDGGLLGDHQAAPPDNRPPDDASERDSASDPDAARASLPHAHSQPPRHSFLKRRVSKGLNMLPTHWCANFLDRSDFRSSHKRNNNHSNPPANNPTSRAK